MNLNNVIEKTQYEFAQNLIKDKSSFNPLPSIEDEKLNSLIEQNKIIIKYIHLLLENYHKALLKELEK